MFFFCFRALEHPAGVDMCALQICIIIIIIIIKCLSVPRGVPRLRTYPRRRGKNPENVLAALRNPQMSSFPCGRGKRSFQQPLPAPLHYPNLPAPVACVCFLTWHRLALVFHSRNIMATCCPTAVSPTSNSRLCQVPVFSCHSKLYITRS